MAPRHTLYILLLSTLILFNCQEDSISDQTVSSQPVELTEVKATIINGEQTTRATEYLEDHISRYQFVPNDLMTFTKIHRTENILSNFSYKDIGFKCNSSSAWERDKNTGYSISSPSVHPDRIYWSDAESGHTFIGYSTPKDNSSFDWKRSAFYYDADGTKRSVDTYYGALGDPTDAELIDYSSATATETQTTTGANNQEIKTTFDYSPAMRNEDLLLAYDTDLRADNSVANIKFYHALSSIRVIVNISGFYGTESDAYSTVSNMRILDQPTMYRWIQSSNAVQALVTDHENSTLQSLWGGGNAPVYDQRKDIKLWCKNPEGHGTGASKTFTFYGIVVPQDETFFETFTNKDFRLTFDVTYPDPMRNDPLLYKVSKAYSATIASTSKVKFYPGKCTTINLSLNHKDETMTIGASYMDWQYVPSPDEGSLKKKSTFLSTTNRSSVTIATDAGATEDDATWLYNKNRNQLDATEDIVDIYGNTGSADSPFTISTADQLLSFAYEVQNGRTFDGLYVKLDADITLQASYNLPTDDNGNIVISSDLVRWIGIGDKDNSFDGFFLGSGRRINNLYGAPFFHTIGTNAVVNKVNFNDAIEVIGSGVLANVNKGLICGCNVEANVSQDKPSVSPSYCGSFVGNNQSFIVACTHVGSVTGHGYVGGLVGRNAGTMIASYHVGLVKFADNATDKQNVGGSTGLKESYSQVFSCYFNKELINHTPDTTPGIAAFGCSTSMMQSNDFVNKVEDLWIDEGFDPATSDENYFKRHYSLNQAMAVFKRWIDIIWTTKEAEHKGGDWTVDTNCRPFTRRQVYWLMQHYNETHKFDYIPATYPKIK